MIDRTQLGSSYKGGSNGRFPSIIILSSRHTHLLRRLLRAASKLRSLLWMRWLTTGFVYLRFFISERLMNPFENRNLLTVAKRDETSACLLIFMSYMRTYLFGISLYWQPSSNRIYCFESIFVSWWSAEFVIPFLDNLQTPNIISQNVPNKEIPTK